MNIASLKESYIGIKQSMDFIPYSYVKILSLIKSGQLPALRLGSKFYIRKTDAEDYVKNNIKNFQGGFYA